MTEQEKTQIYENFSGKVKNYFRMKTNDSMLAEDLCSEVFLKVYQKLDSFDATKAAISTWIYTIAHNTLIDYYRTRKVYDEIPEELSKGESALDEICSEEMLEELATALEGINEKERDIIVLHYYSGMTLKEVAEKLQISYSYVKALHAKALMDLKLRLSIA